MDGQLKQIFAAYRSIVPYLPGNARRYIRTYSVVTSALALLDVAALMLLAVSLTAMVQSAPIRLPFIGTIPPSGYVWILLIVCGLILIKSVLAVLLQWRATRRMSVFELEIGDRLFDAYIRAPWTERLKRNTSHLVRLADVGIGNVTSGFLNPFMSMPALVTTAVCVVVVIAFVQPVTAVVTVVYLGLVALLLYVVLSQRTIKAGVINRDYSLRVASLITDMVGALKEITLRGKSSEVAAVVHRNRVLTSRARANISFLSGVPRFVLDVSLVGGFILVGGSAYIFGGMAGAISAVALFGVAGFRLVPSITGFQSLINQMTANIPHVNAVIRDINDAERYLAHAEQVGHDPIVGTPRALVFDDVSFVYPGSDTPAVRGLSGTVVLGSSLGIVGSSGAGKSTLIDLLLGLLEPTDGEIRLDDQSLADVLGAWRGRVGYVPQDVALFDGTVAQNVALTWDAEIDEEKVRDALRRAHVLDVVETRVGGIHGHIGDRGMKLSGGQRQRLGIARALYADPLVLVLDEATSSLDTATEAGVSAAIRELHDEVTVISVAHRLSTIRDNDEVWFMRDGRIAGRGTFDSVIGEHPEFAEQARLAGLA
ncbi:ABC transporter ATP-binding protein [Microbacterium thalassium]|uniref:ABC transporter ATP-binding protein n=1 Tax=Microbacterium TaxID=33882 RepID=UPI002948BDE6|nr:ABC transporter ATP-binding protein [Microbacterium thalassium]